MFRYWNDISEVSSSAPIDTARYCSLKIHTWDLRDDRCVDKKKGDTRRSLFVHFFISQAVLISRPFHKFSHVHAHAARFGRFARNCSTIFAPESETRKKKKNTFHDRRLMSGAH